MDEPKKWTKDEIERMLELKKTRSMKEVAEILGRTHDSIKIKYKRYMKKERTYNDKHIDEKYKLNEMFTTQIQAKKILDVFAGEKSFYKKLNLQVTSNDINKAYDNEYKMDYLKFLCLMYYKGNTYDMIDLDPFGSAYDGIDLAVKMAKKGIIITLGELGHQRFKRLDFVRNRYNIDTMEKFTTNTMIEHIKMIGLRNKKHLTPVYITKWKNIARVYFEISRAKITEQWENKKETLFNMEG